jgi:hypothetical protein
MVETWLVQPNVDRAVCSLAEKQCWYKSVYVLLWLSTALYERRNRVMRTFEKKPRIRDCEVEGWQNVKYPWHIPWGQMSGRYFVGVLQMSNSNFDIWKTKGFHYTSCGMNFQFVQCVSSRNLDMDILLDSWNVSWVLYILYRKENLGIHLKNFISILGQ